MKEYFPVRTESAALIACVAVMALLASVAIFALSRGDFLLSAAAFGFALFGALFSWPVRYVVDSDRWAWQVGIANNRVINLQDIDRIIPATGRDGYMTGKATGHTVIVGRKKIFFCAQDQPALLRAIEIRCPHLRRYGEEWRRHVSIEQSRAG